MAIEGVLSQFADYFAFLTVAIVLFLALFSYIIIVNTTDLIMIRKSFEKIADAQERAYPPPQNV